MHDWKSIVRARLAPSNLKGPAEADLTEEIAQHLEDCYEAMRKVGSDDEEAFQGALAEFDEMYPRERKNEMPKYEAVPAGDPGRSNLMDGLWRDLRYAVRTMGKSPLFVLFVVLTLALGIGANTTVFTVINTLILNPLPVENASGLTSISVENASKSGAPRPVSYADLADYRAKNQVFSSMAGYTTPRPVTWQREGGSKGLFCELATSNYFSNLGLRPAAGRFFLPEEDGTPGAHPVAVLSYGAWQMHFGGADVAGKTLRLNSEVYTIVGVAPPQFIGINAIFGPDVWVPAAMTESLLPNEMRNAFSDRGKALFQGVGRLKAGVSEAQAQANLSTIATDLAREYPATNEGRKIAVRPIRDALFASASTGSSSIMFASAVLLIVVGIVLLIACSNVANLLLARAASRQQEMAVRLAMGASRSRLVRQLLTESMLLGMMSGALGLFIGYAGLRLLFGTLPSAANFIAPKFDATVFVFSLVISLATGLLFGIIPAFKASRSAVAETLKEEARTTGRNRKRVTLANVLLVGQVAFSFLLLVTAALFLRSIERAYNIDPGFQTSHLAVIMTNPGQAGYGKAQTKAFYKDLKQRAERIPGVASAAWSTNLPLWGRTVNGLVVEGREQKSQAEKITTIMNTVDQGYFETAGVRIDRGRAFSNVDQETSLPVAIVNEKMVHDFWPGGDALGKRIQIPGEKQMREIVGIAGNANYSAWAEPPQICVYVPMEQSYADGMTLYVRSKGDPGQLIKPAEHEIHEAGPQIVLSSRTGQQIIEGGLFQAKVGVGLLSIFGLLALVLASIGLYGILAYSVNQRKREIGLRMALGAARMGVVKLILKEGMKLVLTGVAIGLVASLLVGRALSRLLYGVSASDPLSIGLAVVALSAIALVACYLPARSASRLDPLVALREG